MSALPKGVSARFFVRALHADGFFLKRTKGSHHFFSHPDGRIVVVAYHRLSDTFPVGTLKGMLADTNWQEHDLQRLGLLN